MWILGWWRRCGWGITFPSCRFLFCPWNPSPWICIPHGESSGGGPSFSCPEGSGGACLSSFSRLLQPYARHLEGFCVMEACYRPLCPEPLHPQDPLQDGDHSVCSPFRLTRRLDGLHGPEGCMLAGSLLSGQLQVLEVCGLRGLSISASPRLPKSSPGLWLQFRPFFTI